jgi:hypothetical protein
LFVSIALAQPRRLNYGEAGIGPGTSATAYSIVATAPGANKRNCLIHLDVGVGGNTVAFVTQILSGGTTIYAVDRSTGTTFSANWPTDDPFCVNLNTALNVNVTSASGVAVVAPLVNYKGFIREE